MWVILVGFGKQLLCTQSHYTKEILIGTARHYGNWAPEDWKIVVRLLLKEGEYLQFQMWSNDLCIEKARQNVHSQDPQIRAITYAMLSGTGNIMIHISK